MGVNHACISAIEYYLPAKILDNSELSQQFPEWTEEKILNKTGIRRRHIAAQGETSVDMAVEAAQALFRIGVVSPHEIDFLILCTQSPDYFLPTSACMVQSRLGVPTGVGALDINLGCSGYVYCLSLAQGLIEAGHANRILLITSETYSKFLDPLDKGVRALFGDGAAATLVERRDIALGEGSWLGPFVFGTDGSGAETLIVREGAMRRIEDGLEHDPFLRMDGPSIFSFSLKRVPAAVESLLQKSGLSMGDIDHFIFHQANAFMLEALRKAIGISPNRFYVDVFDKGNTVSSTIPIAISDACRSGRIKPHQTLMLVGFGVGLSWAACVARMPASPRLEKE